MFQSLKERTWTIA